MGALEVIVVAAVTILGLAASAAVFVLLARAVQQAGGGLAAGWQLRCTRCGRTRDATEAGLVRLGAASVRKYTLGYCAGCGERLRVIAIERKPSAPAPGSPAAPATPAASSAGGGTAQETGARSEVASQSVR